MSTSYGKYEKDLPLKYVTALCEPFAELGARGVSVPFPSGNDDVGDGGCKDGSGRVQFIPEFPASCMCSVLFLVGSRAPVQAQVAHHIAARSLCY
jgi:tripeptidyl-peptidase-1